MLLQGDDVGKLVGGLVRMFVRLFVAICLLSAASQAPAEAQTVPGELVDPGGRQQDSRRNLHTAAPPPVGPDSYTLDRGDVLRLNVYGRPDISADYRVSDGGLLRVPQVGNFDARGKSLQVVEDEIRVSLEKLTSQPAYLQLDILERRPFFIVGSVERPGAYPHVPGMTVIHAVALAGGHYRGAPGSLMATELTREQNRVHQAVSELALQLAQRARLHAELENKDVISTPKELLDLATEPLAEQLIQQQTEILQRQNTMRDQNIASLEAAINSSRKEISALEEQLRTLSNQSELRKKQLASIRDLAKSGLVNQQRAFDEEMAASLLARDTQETIASISRAQRALQDNERALALVTLDRKVRIDQDLAILDDAIARNKSILEGSQRLVTQYSGLTDTAIQPNGIQPTLQFEILRRDANGVLRTIEVTEETPMTPGDVLRVTVPTSASASQVPRLSNSPTN